MGCTLDFIEAFLFGNETAPLEIAPLLPPSSDPLQLRAADVTSEAARRSCAGRRAAPVSSEPRKRPRSSEAEVKSDRRSTRRRLLYEQHDRLNEWIKTRADKSLSTAEVRVALIHGESWGPTVIVGGVPTSKCACGSTVAFTSRPRHIMTDKHFRWLASTRSSVPKRIPVPLD